MTIKRFFYSEHPEALDKLILSMIEDGWNESSVVAYFESLEGAGSLARTSFQRFQEELSGMMSFAA